MFGNQRFKPYRKPTLWKTLSTIIKVDSERYIKATGIKQSEIRYYISSLCSGADHILKAIRSHWEVENKVHWSLDVSFNEDGCRKRAGNTAINFSLISSLALNILRKDDTKASIRSKRLLAEWTPEYIFKLLNF